MDQTPNRDRAQSLHEFVQGLMTSGQSTASSVPQTAMATGLADLDECLLGGVHPGELVVVTGVPGVGSSTLAVQIAARSAIVDRVPTTYLAERGDVADVFARVVAGRAKIPINHVRRGELIDTDLTKVARVSDELGQAPLEVLAELSEGATADEIVHWVERGAMGGAKRLIIDLATFDPRDAVGQLRAVARRWEIPVLLAARLHVPSHRASQPPGREDLGVYNEVAAHADAMIVIHRDDMHDYDTSRPGEADLLLLRNRRGPTRACVVAFQGHYARFVDMA